MMISQLMTLTYAPSVSFLDFKLIIFERLEDVDVRVVLGKGIGHGFGISYVPGFTKEGLVWATL